MIQKCKKGPWESLRARCNGGHSDDAQGIAHSAQRCTSFGGLTWLPSPADRPAIPLMIRMKRPAKPMTRGRRPSSNPGMPRVNLSTAMSGSSAWLHDKCHDWAYARCGWTDKGL